jgi:hypothetical protein
LFNDAPTSWKTPMLRHAQPPEQGKCAIMKNIEDFTDSRLKGWCVHCAGSLLDLATNRDHVPTKNLLRPPLPANLPVVEVCQDCNGSFSGDEQYFAAFLSVVVSGTTDPARQAHPPAARILENQPALRSRIERARRESQTATGETEILWTPEYERIERVILKNARGHAFFEYGEPMLSAPTHIRFLPYLALSEDQHNAFEDFPGTGLFPEVGSRLMTRVFTGADLDGPWVIVQDGVYRYAVGQIGTMLVRSVIFEYLVTEVLWDSDA